MLDDCIALLVLVKGSDKATDVSMRNIKEFVYFEAKLKEELILIAENFLFHVVVLMRVEFQLLDGANAFIHLKLRKELL